MATALKVLQLAQGNAVNFGPFPAGQDLDIELTVKNISGADIHFATPSTQITTVQGNADFTIVGGGLDGQTLHAGATAGLLIKFTPTSPAATQEISTLMLLSDVTLVPSVITLIGTSALVTDNFVSIVTTGVTSNIQPPVVDFGDVNAGVLQTSNTITISNPTTQSQLVSFQPLFANGYDVTSPVGANPILAGGSLTVTLKLLPKAGQMNQDDSNALIVTVPTQTYGNGVEALYNTRFVTFHPLLGTEEVFWLGFFDDTLEVCKMLQADPLNLDCEEDASFTRQFMFSNQADLENQVQRVFMQYERLGPTTVTLTYSSISPGNQAAVPQTRTFDSATDGLLRNMLFDGSIAGQVVKITVTIDADDGPFSMTLMELYYEPRGEHVEAT